MVSEYFIVGTHSAFSDSMDMGRPDAAGERRLRLANSSPDVKALFNAPAYIYDFEEQDDSPASYVPGQSLEYWAPLAPIVRAFSDIWCPLTYFNQGSGIPHRTKHADDASKRGSDSLLEAKLKEHISKPRSFQNRAQSLDLTMSLSRIAESTSRLMPPESPTTSTGDAGDNSSPNSATAPSFPSVYAPPKSALIGTSAQRSARVLDAATVEEVSRVISNLGL